MKFLEWLIALIKSLITDWPGGGESEEEDRPPLPPDPEPEPDPESEPEPEPTPEPQPSKTDLLDGTGPRRTVYYIDSPAFNEPHGQVNDAERAEILKGVNCIRICEWSHRRRSSDTPYMIAKAMSETAEKYPGAEIWLGLDMCEADYGDKTLPPDRQYADPDPPPNETKRERRRRWAKKILHHMKRVGAWDRVVGVEVRDEPKTRELVKQCTLDYRQIEKELGLSRKPTTMTFCKDPVPLTIGCGQLDVILIEAYPRDLDFYNWCEPHEARAKMREDLQHMIKQAKATPKQWGVVFEAYGTNFDPGGRLGFWNHRNHAASYQEAWNVILEHMATDKPPVILADFSAGRMSGFCDTKLTAWYVSNAAPVRDPFGLRKTIMPLIQASWRKLKKIPFAAWPALPGEMRPEPIAQIGCGKPRIKINVSSTKPHSVPTQHGHIAVGFPLLDKYGEKVDVAREKAAGRYKPRTSAWTINAGPYTKRVLGRPIRTEGSGPFTPGEGQYLETGGQGITINVGTLPIGTVIKVSVEQPVLDKKGNLKVLNGTWTLPPVAATLPTICNCVGCKRGNQLCRWVDSVGDFRCYDCVPE